MTYRRGCIVAFMTRVIMGHETPDADKLQATVTYNQLWLTCFWFRPRVRASPANSLVEMSFNLAKSQKPRDTDVNYCNFQLEKWHYENFKFYGSLKEDCGWRRRPHERTFFFVVTLHGNPYGNYLRGWFFAITMIWFVGGRLLRFSL
jgi:hypothetical protein